MNYSVGTIMFLAEFLVALAVLLGCTAIKRFFGQPCRKIDLKVLTLVLIGTIPVGLVLASWNIFQEFSDHFLYARTLWGIALGGSLIIYLYVSLMGAIFYLEGRFKDSWLDFWFQLIDPASWGILPFPHGRRMRTLRQSAKVGHFDLRQLPLVMWVNRKLGIEPNPENKG